MDEIDVGKAKAQDFVTDQATEKGIDPSRLQFKWESTPLVLQEYGIELADKIFQLRVRLGEKSRVLSFSELAIRACARSPEDFVTANKDYIIDGLRRLESASAAQISSDSRSSRK